MKFLYNFGMSQDDAETERKALNLQKGDRLICLASAGEVPLNLLASTDVHIDAVDISIPQLHLSRLKMAAALHLDSMEAAQFIGYLCCPEEKRIRLFKHLSDNLDSDEKAFWNQFPALFEKGPVHAARFERYLSRFNGIALRIMGTKKMMKLFDFDDVKLQKHYFDQHLASNRLKLIFNIAFHPRIYKNRGMDKQGLTHSGERDIASFFFSRFRDFCTSTPANKNYFLQFTFYNRILFDEALPEYLNVDGNQFLKQRMDQLSFHQESVSKRIQDNPQGHYNKFALSNVGDWMSQGEMTDLFQLIGRQSADQGNLLLRYIHFAYPLPENLKGIIRSNDQLGHDLESVDRYPFYSLIPLEIQKK